MKKITDLLREYVFGLSIISMIIGLFLLSMGVLWYWFRAVLENSSLQFIHDLGDWNAYLLVAGLIIFGIGLYYLYGFLKNRINAKT